MAVVDSHFITAVHQMELSGLVIEVIQFMCPLLQMKTTLFNATHFC